MAKKKASPARGTKKAPARGKSARGKSTRGGPPKRSGAAADFKSYLKDKASSWKESRKKERTERGGVPDIEDGTYVARVLDAAIKMPKNKPGSDPRPPYFQMRYMVMEPDDNFGIKLTSFDDIDDTPIEAIEGEPCSLDFLSERLQGVGYQIDTLELEELPDLAKQITEEKPWIRVQVVNKSYEKDGITKRLIKVYVRDPLSDEEVEEHETLLAEEGYLESE